MPTVLSKTDSGSPQLSQVFYGGLVIAIADTVFFSTFWGLRGVTPWQIFQSIASGLLGKASFQGGTPTILLGIALHVFIATMFVLVYTLASRGLPALLRRPFVCGPAYGLLAFTVMTYVVVPLSRVPQSGKQNLTWTFASIAFNLVVVGLVSAWFARRAWAVSPRTAS